MLMTPEANMIQHQYGDWGPVQWVTHFIIRQIFCVGSFRSASLRTLWAQQVSAVIALTSTITIMMQKIPMNALAHLKRGGGSE